MASSCSAMRRWCKSSSAPIALPSSRRIWLSFHEPPRRASSPRPATRPRAGAVAVVPRLRCHARQSANAPDRSGPTNSGVPASLHAVRISPQVLGQCHDVQRGHGRLPLPLHANVNVQRAAADVPPNHLFQFGFVKRVRVAAAHRELEVPVVHGSHLDRHAEGVGLCASFAKPGHAQQHAGGLICKEEEKHETSES